MLQIRVQRRKNRPLGGYKTLAMGTVEMSQVQTSVHDMREGYVMVNVCASLGAAGRLCGRGSAVLWETPCATGPSNCWQSH